MEGNLIKTSVTTQHCEASLFSNHKGSQYMAAQNSLCIQYIWSCTNIVCRKITQLFCDIPNSLFGQVGHLTPHEPTWQNKFVMQHIKMGDLAEGTYSSFHHHDNGQSQQCSLIYILIICYQADANLEYTKSKVENLFQETINKTAKNMTTIDHYHSDETHVTSARSQLSMCSTTFKSAVLNIYSSDKN